jgi:ornithine--oxo-acid transaminase
MTSADFIALEESVGAHNYKPLPVVIKKGEGIHVWDVEGKQYIDGMSAYSALSLGHCHPRIMAKLLEQAGKLTLTSRAFYNDQLGPFLKKLTDTTGYGCGLPVNTGVEAVETAIKAARRWGYRVKKIPQDKAKILVFNDNFHGRTTTVVGFSSHESYRQDFGPFDGGFIRLPFGGFDAIEKEIQHNSICAVLVESIQGEGGIVIPPAGWLRHVSDLCKKHNVLLIADEVQTGLGRTGKMFAYEHEGVRPDGLILGKALGGGVYPVSVFLADESVMSLFEPGSHGSTFGGNPLGVAIASEVLEILKDEHLVENSAKLGERFIEGIRAISHPGIQSVRGRGLFVGIVIDPKFASAYDVAQACLNFGLLTKDTHQTVLRLAPPLIIDAAGVDEIVSCLRKALGRIKKLS